MRKVIRVVICRRKVASTITSQRSIMNKSLSKPLKEFAEQAEILADLRASNDRLSRQLRQAKVSKQELVDAVYRAAKDGVSGLQLKHASSPKTDTRKKDSE